MCLTMPTNHDTQAVAEFMTAFGQPVRTSPTADITPEERLLRVRLVVEEALEFAEAMGCIVSAPEGSGGVLASKKVDVVMDEFADIDLVEAADAIADLVVVTKGSAHTLGINVDAVFDAVHTTNMAKMDPATGKPVIREWDGKVIKPEGWVPPTEAIKAILAGTAEMTVQPSLRKDPRVRAEKYRHRHGD